MADNQSDIITAADGTTRARTPDIWNHLPEAEKAAMIAQWQSQWMNRTTPGSPISPAVRFDAPTTIVVRPRRDPYDGTGYVSAEDIAALESDSWK